MNESSSDSQKGRDEIADAYRSEPWWYDLRGFFILTFAYRSTLGNQLRFFGPNFGPDHIEIACGTGTLLKLVLLWRRWKNLPQARITGIDYAESMLAGARRRFAGNSALQFQHADAAALPFQDASFDSANIANSIHCCPDVDGVLHEALRVLKSGGTLAANVLLFPQGVAPLKWLAARINRWGMRKGILYTPYRSEDIRARLLSTGFELLSETISGNCYNVLVRKPRQVPENDSPLPARLNQQEVSLAPETPMPDGNLSKGNGPKTPFSYESAFDRNLGWVTAAEQASLRGKCVAIAGLGGAGGAHLLTLARLGVGRFHLADLDTFGIENFNRQVGATMATIGRPKIDVMAEMALEINPEIEIEYFRNGVNATNNAQFLAGADLYIDGLDFFVLDERQHLFALCESSGIPALTVAPLGMGAALLVFMPGRMTFEQYFRLGSFSQLEKASRFLAGLSPALLQRSYLADSSKVDLSKQKGPSTAMGCQLCAAIAATEALKILLGRGRVLAAPRGVHFDAYKNKLKRTWRPWGNANPLQRLLLIFVKRQLRTMAEGGAKR
jgi:molybdopterin/thiamine biosynthesis adenylyltransferase/ubiquinone/menaquinone biosynthesis C-methylase UbiE